MNEYNLFWRIVLVYKPDMDVGSNKDNDDNAEMLSSVIRNTNMINSVETPSTDQSEVKVVNSVNTIMHLKQHRVDKLTTRCYQLKLHQTEKDDDFEEVVRTFYKPGTPSVLDKLKLVRDQWRKLDFWQLAHSVNPRPMLQFVRNPLGQTNEQISENPQDDTAFERSIVHLRRSDEEFGLERWNHTRH